MDSPQYCDAIQKSTIDEISLLNYMSINMNDIPLEWYEGIVKALTKNQMDYIYNIVNENILKARKIKNSIFISKNNMKRNSIINSKDKADYKIIKIDDQNININKDINHKDNKDKLKSKSILKKQKSKDTIASKQKLKQEKEKAVKRINKLTKEYNLDYWQEKYLLEILNVPTNIHSK